MAVVIAVAAASAAVLAHTAADAPAPASPHGAPLDVLAASDIDSPQVPPRLASASNEFAFDFYRQASSGDGNVFFSPVSMYAAFSMLYEGARGGTAAQIRDVFGFDPGPAARHNATARAMAALNADGPRAALEAGNAVWVAGWFRPPAQYPDTARETCPGGGREGRLCHRGLGRREGGGGKGRRVGRSRHARQDPGGAERGRR